MLLFTHRFSDRIRFVGELELEHAFVEGLEEAGELELEQAYLDFLLSRSFNVRAGMLLMPVGIINERHEPPVYYGVERPLVDTVIIPTTWFEVGAGVHGEVGRGWRYRAYVTAPLNAAEFSAEEGCARAGRKAAEPTSAAPRRPDASSIVGVRGLTAGASFWAGESGFEFRPRFDVPVAAVEADARYAARPPRAPRASSPRCRSTTPASSTTRSPAPRASTRTSRARFAASTSKPAIASSPAPRFGDVGAFVRYENFDTQYRMPDGYVPLEQFDRDAWVIGATYWPDPDVAIKVDYVASAQSERRHPRAASFNVGLGWWF